STFGQQFRTAEFGLARYRSARAAVSRACKRLCESPARRGACDGLLGLVEERLRAVSGMKPLSRRLRHLSVPESKDNRWVSGMKPLSRRLRPLEQGLGKSLICIVSGMKPLSRRLRRLPFMEQDNLYKQ